MARTSIVSRTLLASTLLASALLAGSVGAAPAPAPVLEKSAAHLPRTPSVPVESIAREVRVVMELSFDTTTDSTEVGMPLASNTEDEIFYSLSGARVVDGKQTAFIPTEVRPSGARDIWEMGPSSNKTLTRTLFEGSLSAKDRAVLTVAIGEQDNAQRDALVNLFKAVAQYAGDALEKELGTEGTYDAFKGSTKQEMIDDAVALINDIGKRDDQVVGVFAISASRSKLEVTGGDGMFSKVTANGGKSSTVKLSGYGGRYTVKLRLEDVADAPRPDTAVFLGEEHDKCGEDVLKVSGKKIQKGQTVEVSVPNKRFDWHCGGTLEHTTAPAPTNKVQVRRAASGRDITWRCFFASTPKPDYAW